MFKIIINCHRTEFLGKCLESVRAQTVKDWEAYVTLDACAWPISFSFEKRVHVQRNTVRKYSLPNQISAIARSGSNPEDIIVSLDGDDWFARHDALSIISDTYATRDCWMTYGSWKPASETIGLDPGIWPAYPDGTTDFRNHRWLGTAVRTWKRWLWDRLKDSDLRDDDGQYFHIAEDRAIMTPLLEMSGTRHAKHIATPIMIYNADVSDYSAADLAEAERTIETIKGRRPYPTLAERPCSFAGGRR